MTELKDRTWLSGALCNAHGASTVIVVALSFSGCTVDATCSERWGTRSDRIKIDDGSLAATDVIEPVVVSVLLDGPSEPRPICTGTRIAAGVVLTAGHCVRDVPIDHLSVRTAASQALSQESPDDDCASSPPPPVDSSPVLDAVEHAELDLAVLHVEEALDRPFAGRAQAPLAVDRTATIAGFGTTETFERGALRAIDVDVLAVDDHWITVQARGGGACTGDSGGPLYTWAEGQVTLHGVLSRGSASCLGKDEYVPLVAASGWIESVLDP